jgi:Short C-terminal domain
MAEKPVSHGLGFGSGSIIEHPDGSAEYRQTGKLLPAFRVVICDISGFSARKVTRDDKKRLDASSMQQVLTIQGSGTTLAEVAVNHGTAQKIEQWFRARPEFGKSSRASTAPAGPSVSVADELAKLVQLRDAGVLSPEEFVAQKAKLLS